LFASPSQEITIFDIPGIETAAQPGLYMRLALVFANVPGCV
jgi:hypothetical protein